MSRIDVLEQRMFDLMPVSPVMPIIGPRVGRTRIYGAAIAGDVSMIPDPPSPLVLGDEQQMEEASNQLNEGAILTRIDDVIPPGGTAIPADSWDLTQSAYWLFTSEVTTAPGAAGAFLEKWGKMIQIPRYTSESDATYAKRIIAEAIMSVSTNFGMATFVNTMLNVVDSLVIEAATFDEINAIRYDDGNRMDDGLRYSSVNLFDAPSYWNCFILFLSVDLPHNGYSAADLNSLINRHKAAGNRCIAIITPNFVLPNQ
jgi:hypothetical protein